MESVDQALSFFKHMQGKIRFSHGKMIKVQRIPTLVSPLSSCLSPYIKFLYSLYYNIILCFTKTITFLSLGKYY